MIVVGVQAKAFLYSYKDKNKIKLEALINYWIVNIL